MRSYAAASGSWQSIFGINKHLGAISALIFSLILSACGGGGGGGGNPGPAQTGAPALTEVSMSSGELTTVTVGDKVSVMITANEAIQAPSVVIGGTAADRVVGSGTSWTADRIMTTADTAGVISLSVSFSDIGGEAGVGVTETTDGSSLTMQINNEGGAVVDGPFQNARVFADYNGNGILDTGEPSSSTDANGEYNLVNTTFAPESYNIVAEMTETTIDSISGESYADSALKLKAPTGGAVVTPLTTVLVAAQAADPTFTADDLAVAMGLPAGIDIETYNPFASGVTDSEAHAVEKVFQQVMTATLIVSEAMEGVAGITGASLSAADSSAAALLAVTKMITDSTVTVDFSDATQIADLQEVAKDELLAQGIVDESSVSIADYVLGNATSTVTQLATAIQAVDVANFGKPASSAVSLLKHDAAGQMASLATAAADFLKAGSTDLTQLDISSILTLASADGVTALVDTNLEEVEKYRSTLGGVVTSWGPFADATIDDGLFTFPSGVADYAGFANETSSLYPFMFSVGGTITFNASIPEGAAPTTVKFTFENAPYPDTNPNFSVEQVVSSSTETTYRVDIPAQDPEQTYRSLIMYIIERDAPVKVCNVQISLGDDYVEGIPCQDVAAPTTPAPTTPAPTTPAPTAPAPTTPNENVLALTLVAPEASTVRIVGPWWDGWSATSGPAAVENGDGTWTVQFDPKPDAEMEYKWLVDGVQEVLQTPAAAGECTALIDAARLKTDYANWGNRYWDPAVHGSSYTEYAGGCVEPLTLQLLAPEATAVRIVGPWWEGWSDTSGPEATDGNGDGIWTVQFDPKPDAEMEYKWLIDGVQEVLQTPAAAGECTALIDAARLKTDYANWGNRYWDPAVHGSSYIEYAGGCVEPLTLELLAPEATAVRIVGPWWDGWTDTSGPEATDGNGDGIWTVQFGPKPDAEMEYKWLVDGVQEVLQTPAAAGECTALIDAARLKTDYANWGNRYWDPAVHGSRYVEYASGCIEPLTLSVQATAASAVRIVGPWWEGWSDTSGPEATDGNGDGFWTVQFDPKPDAEMEYKWLIDGVQEVLQTSAAAGECAALIDAARLKTDYANWGNRYWDPAVHGSSYIEYAGACGPE
ncbi:MAG: hypothetical protein ACPH3I_05610 [Porticoccaceae bacterium]